MSDNLFSLQSGGYGIFHISPALDSHDPRDPLVKRIVELTAEILEISPELVQVRPAAEVSYHSPFHSSFGVPDQPVRTCVSLDTLEVSIWSKVTEESVRAIEAALSEGFSLI